MKEPESSDEHERHEGDSPTQRVVGFIRRALANLTLVVVALLVALGLAELLVRGVRPQRRLDVPDLWRAVDSVGYEKKPGLDTQVNLGESPVRFLTDEEGFRVGTGGRVESEERVLILGDSFMEALGVEHEVSVAGRLEASLAEHLGHPVAVRNTGVSGWTPDQYLTRARWSVATEPPDVVIVALFLGNDLVAARSPSRSGWHFTLLPRVRFPDPLTWEGLKHDLLFPAAIRLSSRSHLFTLAWRGTELLRMRLGFWEGFLPFGLEIGQEDSDRWNVAAGICAEIAEVADRAGAPTAVVLLPHVVQVTPDGFERSVHALGRDVDDFDLDQPNRVMARHLRERGLEVIDALPALREAHARGIRTYGRVDRHLSPAGHEVVAGLLEEWLLGVLPRDGADRPSSSP